MPLGDGEHGPSQAVEAALAILPQATSDFLRDPHPGMFDVGDIVRAYSDFFFRAQLADWSMARALAAAADVVTRELQRAGVPAVDVRYRWLQSQIPRWAVGYFG